MTIHVDHPLTHVEQSIQADIEAELTKEGSPTKIKKHPTSSPEFNVLDLGFFHSLQTKAAELKDGGDLVDIIASVEKAFVAYTSETLERIWQAMFHVFNKTLEELGGNDFAVPHSGTTGAQNHGDLR